MLNETDVQYLVIGGYAVGYHGYPRATADMDIWVDIVPENAKRLVEVFRRFGMQDPELTPALFQQRGKIIRMGVPPLRIEILTEIDGVSFGDCYAERVTTEIDGQQVQLISHKHLLINKKNPSKKLLVRNKSKKFSVDMMKKSQDAFFDT